MHSGEDLVARVEAGEEMSSFNSTDLFTPEERATNVHPLRTVSLRYAYLISVLQHVVLVQLVHTVG